MVKAAFPAQTYPVLIMTTLSVWQNGFQLLLLLRKICCRAAEIPQWFTALAPFSEDLSSVPGTQGGGSQLPIYPSPRDVTPFSGF